MKRSLALLTASAQRRLLLTREVSAVELVEACLERIDRLNGRINAVCTVSERALDEARQADERFPKDGGPPGLLHGLPVGIKDVTETAGLRTTFGSPLFADHVPARDDEVVARVRRAGGIVVGKTNTPEFAAGGHTFNDLFGVTRNPWDPERSAGGSTGGGAAALASGMISLAQGTDLGGSLRIPAAFCGVVGLRPSPGLVPSGSGNLPFDTLDVTGPMGRTAEDVALMLQAICGPSASSPLFQPTAGRDFVAATVRGPSSNLRVAYCARLAGIEIDPEVERVCRRATEELLQEGIEVEEIDLDLSFARETFRTLRGLWMVSYHWERLERLDELGPNLAGNLRHGLALDPRGVAGAERERARLWQLFRELQQRFHLLLTPTVAVPPFPAEEGPPRAVGSERMRSYVDWFAPTFVLSLTGLPVASVPCGLDARGLPVGIQVVGRPRGEEGVLEMARLIEEACPIGSPPF